MAGYAAKHGCVAWFLVLMSGHLQAWTDISDGMVDALCTVCILLRAGQR